MLNCKEVSRLVSESLDRELPLRERMGVQFHLMMCSMCRTYSHQMHVLRQVVRRSAESGVADQEPLPEDVRNRIRQAMKDQSHCADD